MTACLVESTLPVDCEGLDLALPMNRPMLLVALAAIAVVAVVGWNVMGDGESLGEADTTELRPNDAELVAKGAGIYATHCAACHGARLEGQPDWRTRGPDGLLPAPPHDASGHTWHHPDETLFRITKFGVAKIIDDPKYKTAMPVYEGQLSDNEIIAVLSWIKAQWPASIRQRHDQMNAQAAKSPRP